MFLSKERLGSTVTTLPVISVLKRIQRIAFELLDCSDERLTIQADLSRVTSGSGRDDFANENSQEDSELQYLSSSQCS
jgi:hypothetical protein